MNETYINIHSHRQQTPDSITVLNVGCHELPVDLDLSTFDWPSCFSIGIHPWFFNPDSFRQQWKTLQELSRHPNCVAIGECGLDQLIDLDKKTQIKIFMQHAELAQEQNKPLIIHCVRAYHDLLQLKRHHGDSPAWIIHGFNKYKFAEPLLNEGIYLSLGHNVLRPNHPIARLLPDLPLDHLFLETDDTDTPDIDTIYQTAATIAGLTLMALKQQLYNNFKRIFLV
jgi:TatD DNase family protein